MLYFRPFGFNLAWFHSFLALFLIILYVKINFYVIYFDHIFPFPNILKFSSPSLPTLLHSISLQEKKIKIRTNYKNPIRQKIPRRYKNLSLIS